ncbi:MAG TPA: SpoIIE family protein phosphatase [Acidisarcina sp.]
MNRYAALTLLLWLFLSGSLLPAGAQTVDASHLGIPALDLSGNWRVHYGDDPRWADAAFDDSQWSLQPANAAIILKNPYRGFLWYRMRVQLPARHGSLSLLIRTCRTSCELFINGRSLGEYGGMPPHASLYETQPVAYTLDLAPDVQFAEVAIRVWSRSHWKPGLGPNAVRIGDEAVIANEVREGQRIIDEDAVQYVLINAAFFLLALTVLALFAVQRDRKEYLWLAAWQICNSVSGLISTWQSLSLIPAWTQYFIAIPLEFISLAFTLEFYYSFVGQKPGRFIRWLQVAVLATMALGPGILFGLPAPKLYGYLVLVPEAQLIIATVVITVMLLGRFRRGSREAGLLLVPTFLSNFSTVLNLAREAAVSLGWTKNNSNLLPDTRFGDFVFTADTWFSLLFILSILALLLYRFTNVSRQQTRSAAEIEAAREVQQVLLPEQSPSMPGISIESEYHPADVVGGDFFQVIPALDGSLLVVVGDVAGKGMGAAMLVGVIIGTIRTIAQFEVEPAAVLATLNERLCGRVNGSFVTCIAARLTEDGELTVANGGHLPPYLNGEELTTLPELPLGVSAGVSYEQSHFTVAPGDRLTFVSDGVVEATRPGGELFGFERTRQISRDPARTIAEAAKAFGQTDDITVVTLTRSLTPVASVA